MSSIKKMTMVSILSWRGYFVSNNYRCCSGIRWAAKTPNPSELDWTQRPWSLRRNLSSHPQSSAKEGQFLAGFGILPQAIDACSNKRK